MKLFKKSKKGPVSVEERREEVLATGRKFKYPLQWSRHRVVINTVLIAVVVVALVITAIWLALYRLGGTDDFLFRLTRVFPVSVASVDNESVRFSDYLMFYRSSITSLERQSGNQFDEETLADLQNKYKREALTDAEEYTYALKLGNELGISVSDEEVATEFSRHLNLGGTEKSEESFLKIIEDNFDLSKSEYERMLYLSLMKAKVSAAIDETANESAATVENLLAENGNDFLAVAEALGDKITYEETGGLVDSKNLDGGRATEALKLEAGETSGKFLSVSGDGYYFVKLIEKSEDEVNFVSIKITFSEFDLRFAELFESGLISEYIELPATDSEEN